MSPSYVYKTELEIYAIDSATIKIKFLDVPYRFEGSAEGLLQWEHKGLATATFNMPVDQLVGPSISFSYVMATGSFEVDMSYDDFTGVVEGPPVGGNMNGTGWGNFYSTTD